MKTKSPLFLIDRLLIAFAILLAANSSSLAGDLYWDANGGTSGTGGTGTWTTANTWRTNSATGTLVTWPNTGDNNAFFEGTAGTVTIGATAVTLGTGTAFFNTTGYTLTTDGATTRTLTGNLSIGNGLTLNVFGSGVTTGRQLNLVGSVSGGTLVVTAAPSTATVTARLNFTGANSTISSALILSNNAGAGTVAVTAAAANLQITGLVSIFGNAAFGGTSGNDTTFASNAVISGTGNLYFAAGASGGAGAVIINSQSTYTGETRFNMASSGVVRLGTNNALSTNSAVVMGYSSANGGILDLNGFNQTLTSLASGVGVGSIRNSGASTSTLSITGAANTTFGLVISNATSAIAFSRSGSGTTTLSGANTFTGGTTLSGGGITLSGSGTLGGSNNAVTVSGGTLNLGGSASVTNASLTISGGVLTNGTFNAPTYQLNGGTIAGNLGAGTINVGGSTALNGTAAATTVNITNGTLTLGSADRLANGASVSIAGGTLGMQSFTDAVDSFSITSGNLDGSGTLTASTYSLGGGTVNANLGGGTATAASGTTTVNGNIGGTLTASGGTVDLNGTLADDLTVSGGTVNLGSANRLDNAMTVTVSSGTLGMSTFSDEVGSFTISGSGILGGSSGVLTASTYALQGGTINAKLGAGAITVTTGTTSLGSAGRLDSASTLAVNSGELSLGGNETVAALSGAGGTVNIGSATLSFGGNNANTSFAGDITGTGGGITKAGSGTATLSANTAYTGATTINAGTLVYNGTNTSTAVAVNSGGTLGGSGSVGAVTVNSGGIISPGNSPGTLAVDSLTLNGGGSYRWEVTDATAAAGTGWDVINVSGGSGAITLNANIGNQFTITVVGSSPSNFTASTSYTWDIIDAGSWVSAFDADAFLINTNGFSASGTLGTWSVANNSGNLRLVYTAPVSSSIYTWNSTDGAWSDGTKWTNTTPPGNGSSLVFSGASGGASTNDSQVNDIDGLSFSNTAGSYTLSGSAFTNSANGIVNNSSSGQTIDNDITLGAAQAFDAAAGDLTFGGAIDNNSNLLTIAGSENTVLNGVVSGNGGLTKSGAGSLTLGGNNSFTGTLAVNAGTVLVNGTQATTTLNVGGGTLLLGASDVLANSATLTLNSGAVNLGSFSDAISTYNQVAGTITNGSLAATTYNLTGGTMGAGLNGGTVNVGGNISLSGTITNGASVNITNETLTYAANDRIGDNSTVTVNGGTLALGTFSDAIDVYNQVAGTITNGSLAATTYNLTGGTMGAGLNGGAVNVGGAVSLSGTITNGASVNITNGGTLTYGANNRIGEDVTVTVDGGTLNLATYSDTIDVYNQVAGSVTNGTLTASAYNLQGGTVAANLGTGAITVSAGTTTLGSAGRLNSASTLEVNSGQITLGGNETVASISGAGGTVALGANTLTAGGGNTSTTYSGVFTGGGTFAKAGSGSVTLAGDNSGFSGTINVQSGGIVAANNNALGASAVTLTNGSIQAASGVTIANNFTIGAQGSPEVYYTQNFDSIGSGLPTDWTVNTGATASSLGTSVGFTTSAVVWSNTSGAFKNYASATGLSASSDDAAQNASTDRALGIRQTGTVGDPGAAFVYAFDTTGKSVSSISLDLMMLSVQGRTTVWSLEYGIGASPTSFTSLGTWTTPGVWGTTSTNFSTSLFGTNLNNQTDLIFRMVALSGSTGSGSRDSIAIDNFVINTFGANVGTGILGIHQAGSATFSGAITNLSSATLTAASGGFATFSGNVSGAGSVTKTGAGTVTLTGNNTYAGGTTLSAGVLRLESVTGAGTGEIAQADGTSTLAVATTGTIANDMSVYNVAFLDSATLSGTVTVNNATFDVVENETSTISGVVDGEGGVTKTGLGQLTLSGNNTFSGATEVNAGVLELASTVGGAAASTSSVSVASGATLLISQSNQVNNSASVTLSGGTITRGSGVSEVFGSLNLTAASFLDFGTGATGSLTFGTYQNNETPSALLTLNNFIPGNSFTFSNALFAADGSNINSYFTFGTGFVNSSITSNGGNSFTITAIPEPSTYLAAAGLLSLMLWPSRKRLLKDAKKIFGMTPPMRDRLARRAS